VIVLDRQIRGVTAARLPTTGSLFNLPGNQQSTSIGAGSSETNIVAATTITGDTPCRSTDVDYRLDTPSACGFLANYVSLP
jgi:hypothetical protein